MLGTIIRRVLLPSSFTKFAIHTPLRVYESNFVHKTNMKTPDDVYQFWMPKEKSLKENFASWFKKDPDLDQRIKDEFGDLISKLRNGELKSWEEDECLKSRVAVIILLDQFCRNIYRGTADAFSHDWKAREVAFKIVDSGRNRELTTTERILLYMPYMHHEDLQSQERCVELFEEMAKELEGHEDQKLIQGNTDYAIRHRDAIKLFGRFPGRNKALGRENTPEEEEALKSGKYSF